MKNSRRTCGGRCYGSGVHGGQDALQVAELDGLAGAAHRGRGGGGGGRRWGTHTLALAS